MSPLGIPAPAVPPVGLTSERSPRNAHGGDTPAWGPLSPTGSPGLSPTALLTSTHFLLAWPSTASCLSLLTFPKFPLRAPFPAEASPHSTEGPLLTSS